MLNADDSATPLLALGAACDQSVPHSLHSWLYHGVVVSDEERSELDAKKISRPEACYPAFPSYDLHHEVRSCTQQDPYSKIPQDTM